jgi:Domain of unknown function (DUF5658)
MTKFSRLVVVIGAAQSCDLATTVYGLSRHITYEADPIMGPIWHAFSYPGLVAAKVIAVVLATLILWRIGHYQGPRWTALRRVALFVAIMTGIGPATFNAVVLALVLGGVIR